MASRFHHVLTLFNDDDDVSNEHIAANGSPADQLGLEITFESKMEEKKLFSYAINILSATEDNPYNDYNKVRCSWPIKFLFLK